MRHLILIATVLAASITAMGQWDSGTRLGNYADQLKRASRDLADRTSQDLLRNYNNQRNDIENAFLAQQIDAASSLFLDMARNRRPANELRDAAGILSDLSRRAPTFSMQSSYWRAVTNSVNDINRELSVYNGGGGGGGWNPGPPVDNRPIIGRVYWRGKVDDRIQLKIRANFGDTMILSGSNYGPGSYSFTSGLPERNVEVGINKKKGRGRATIVQQPSRANNYTLVVEVYDEDSGAKDYELDIFWR